MSTLPPWAGAGLEDYSDTWQVYRQRRNRCVLLAAGLVVFVGLLNGRPVPVASPLIAGVFIAGLVGLIGGLLVSWIQLNYMRCPRCGKRFCATWWYNLGPFARKCVHCGLRKFADHDDAAAVGADLPAREDW